MTLRPGWIQAIASIAVAAMAVVVIAAPSWERTQTPGRLAISGTIFFALALAIGSRGLVAIGGAFVLAAGLFTTAGAENIAWVRSAAIGILLFVAIELAWDAIERRDGIARTSAFNGRKIDETTRVVVLSLAVTGAIYGLSSLAPSRTVFVIGLALLGVAVALGVATRRLRESEPEESSL